MDSFEEMGGKLKKVGIAGVLVILALIAMINSCSIVQQRERVNQPEKKRKIFYENKTPKNCTICNYFAHGAICMTIVLCVMMTR